MTTEVRSIAFFALHGRKDIVATQYIGFTGDQLSQIQRVNIEMGSALEYVLDTSFSRTDVFSRALENYFGSDGKNQNAVMTVLNSMLLAFRAGTYDIKMAAGTANAAAVTLGSAWGGRVTVSNNPDLYHKPYIQRAQDRAQQGNKLVIEVMPKFFNLPFKAKDRQTQVETLIHELSHHAANTEDETVLGITCYEAIGVKMAKWAGKAANNAENHGFFIASFQNFA
jgi:hypothetical protein